MSSGKDHLLRTYGGEDDTMDAELSRLHGLSRPPRFLFTIKGMLGVFYMPTMVDFIALLGLCIVGHWFQMYRKRRVRQSKDGPNSVSETIARWKEHSLKLQNTSRKALGNGSKKGCMRGKKTERATGSKKSPGRYQA